MSKLPELSKEQALDVLRSHIRFELDMHPNVLARVLAAVEAPQTTVTRGTSAADASVQVTCCYSAYQARRFIIGEPVSIDDLVSISALVLSLHSGHHSEAVRHGT